MLRPTSLGQSNNIQLAYMILIVITRMYPRGIVAEFYWFHFITKQKLRLKMSYFIQSNVQLAVDVTIQLNSHAHTIITAPFDGNITI